VSDIIIRIIRTAIAPHSQPNPTPSLFSALSEPEWPQQANSHVTACRTAHVCIDAQAGGRVTKIAVMVKH